MEKLEFINKLSERFGEKFSPLDLPEKFSVDDKIFLGCSEHGVFSITPYHLFKSQFGCRKCRVFDKRFDSDKALVEFIDKAEELHGKGNFDYSKVVFKNNLKDKVEITCNTCKNSYSQRAQSHLDGTGCGYCSGRHEDRNSFILKAKEVHGDKYDYSLVEYKGTYGEVELVCNKHESNFWITPGFHINNGIGCPECSLEKKQLSKAGEEAEDFTSMREYFIHSAKKIHGDKYDYSKVEYGRNNKEPVTIICKEHGEFLCKPNSHTIGKIGCPGCSKRTIVTTNTFIEEYSKKNPGSKYSLTEVTYVNSATKIKVTCPIHGEWLAIPRNFYHSNSGCPKCGQEKRKSTNRTNLVSGFGSVEERFISEANVIHGDKYDYSKVDIGESSLSIKVSILCKSHGEFKQLPSDHLDGHGCPKCNHLISKGESEVSEFINSLGLTTINNTGILDRKHIDIFIPELNLGIEYCGLYYHGELKNTDTKYHLNKFTSAKEKGIQLLQVFEDEWLHRKELVKEVLKVKLGKSGNTSYARNYKIGRIDLNTANIFFDTYHLQGKTGSITNSYSLVNKSGSICGAMSFSSANVSTSEIELVRFATVGNIVGGFSKLLKFAISEIKKLGYTKIISYSDNRWSLGKVYELHGFSTEGVSIPRYWWCKQSRRYHRRNFQRRNLPKILPIFEESLSESENCRANGYYKIWDAGITKWSINI